MIKEIDEDENTNLVKCSKQGEAHETAGCRKESDDTEVVDFSNNARGRKREFVFEERSRLLTKFKDKRKKTLSAKRDEVKRKKPLTQAQQRTYMSNYIKNIGGYTLKQLKQYSFEEIKMLFDQTIESIRNFVPMESKDQIADSKAEEGSSKEGKSLKRPVEEELGQEQQKKQQVKEVIVKQEDVVAKQVVKESSKKAGGRLKRKTSKAREDKDKRQKKQVDQKTYTYGLCG
nr:hypothetical protein [Tanacetum cinerariifolium]